ncbi:IS66 family insertion sequence element accessory protein TnpB [Brevibacillus sp. AY1]|nr:IS66 family insertion sequence element accessory protein TnpB [Brevibacillus sp. AY1]
MYLACGTTDLRKSIDGLAAIVQEQFSLDPFSAAYLCFVTGGGTSSRSFSGIMRAFGFIIGVSNVARFNGPPRAILPFVSRNESCVGYLMVCPYHNSTPILAFHLKWSFEQSHLFEGISPGFVCRMNPL